VNRYEFSWEKRKPPFFWKPNLFQCSSHLAEWAALVPIFSNFRNHISTSSLFIVFNANCKKLWTPCRYCITSHSSSYVKTSGCCSVVIINRCPDNFAYYLRNSSNRKRLFNHVFCTDIFCFVLCSRIRMKRISWSTLNEQCYIIVLLPQLNIDSLMTSRRRHEVSQHWYEVFRPDMRFPGVGMKFLGVDMWFSGLDTS
jgi:hypothetical protein